MTTLLVCAWCEDRPPLTDSRFCGLCAHSFDRAALRAAEKRRVLAKRAAERQKVKRVKRPRRES